MTVVEGGIEEQTNQVFKNFAAVLKEAGSSPAQVLKTTCVLPLSASSSSSFVPSNL